MLNLAQVIRIEFEPGGNKGISWFEVTDQEQVKAIRTYIDLNILKCPQGNTQYVWTLVGKAVGVICQPLQGAR